MNRYLEALAFGLAGLVVFAIQWAVLMLWSAAGLLETSALTSVVSLVAVTGLVVLGFAAGRRSSVLDLLAVIASPIVFNIGLRLIR